MFIVLSNALRTPWPPFPFPRGVSVRPFGGPLPHKNIEWHPIGPLSGSAAGGPPSSHSVRGTGPG